MQRLPHPLLDDDAEDDGNGPGDDMGDDGGSGTGDGGGGGGDGGGDGQGDGEGGIGGRGGRPQGKPIPLSNVRLIPVEHERGRYQVSFLPHATGNVRISIREMGDSTSNDLPGLTFPSANVDNFQITDGARAYLEVQSHEQLDRSIRLTAMEIDSDEG